MDYVARNRRARACLGDNIFHMAELDMQKLDCTGLMTAGAALATSIDDEGVEAGAKALAASVVDLFLDTGLVKAAKETFRDEIGNTRYQSMLPADQPPPVELNRAMMERDRARLCEHYPAEKPQFE